jgi:hypothetical protein
MQKRLNSLTLSSNSPTAELPDHLLEARPARIPDPEPPVLGQPLGIREVAHLIGCSVWSVRQTLIPKGLPHFRSGSSGKLIFYRNQVVRWILDQQKKGGTIKPCPFISAAGNGGATSGSKACAT